MDQMTLAFQYFAGFATQHVTAPVPNTEQNKSLEDMQQAAKSAMSKAAEAKDFQKPVHVLALACCNHFVLVILISYPLHACDL